MQKLLGFIMAVFVIISCQKEENNDSPQSKANHWPLAIGNYWVYQHVEINSSGGERIYSKLDSISINRDTTINGNKYFIIEGFYYPFFNYKTGIVSIVRDSSGYVVNPKGTIIFAENNFNDVLSNSVEIDPTHTYTLYTTAIKMEKVSNTVTVPAGTFEVINCKETIDTELNTGNVVYPRDANNYYANNVGPILKTMYWLSSEGTMEKRLIRYHISK